jgi:acyl-CoA synthetase (AMP-forming)/AMP-acid ligase II
MRFLNRLLRHASVLADHSAVVTEGFTLSYRDLFHCVATSVLGLKNAGFAEADVVGISLDNEVENLIASLGLMAIGASQITLSTHDSALLQTTLAERAGVKKVLRDFDQAWLKPGTSQVDQHLPDASIAGVVYFKTSGTTGEINIVPLTENQMAKQAARNAEYATERLLRLASIEHNNSKRHRLYCLWAGGTNVFRPKRASFSVIDFVLTQNVTCLDVSMMHAADIASLDGADKLCGVKLRTGGSAIPFGLRRRIEENVTRNLYVRYAATECGSISMARPGEHDEAEGSGVILDGVVLEIVNDGDERMDVGEKGQIRLRAPGIATCYVNSPGDTAKRFRDGWFYPGDVGYIGKNGALIVHGRSDDMFILNGVNIFPVEIERILESHPDVSCAAALGLPSQVHGHIPVAAVEMKKSARTSPSELRNFARAALGLRAPRRILVLESLPRNPQGKITRRALLPLFTSRA